MKNANLKKPWVSKGNREKKKETRTKPSTKMWWVDVKWPLFWAQLFWISGSFVWIWWFILSDLSNAGDLGSIPGLGRSPGEGQGNPLQYSCLEDSMDRGAWRVTMWPWGHKEWDLTERLGAVFHPVNAPRLPSPPSPIHGCFLPPLLSTDFPVGLTFPGEGQSEGDILGIGLTLSDVLFYKNMGSFISF